MIWFTYQVTLDDLRSWWLKPLVFATFAMACHRSKTQVVAVVGIGGYTPKTILGYHALCLATSYH